MLLQRAAALVHSSRGEWEAALAIYDELLAFLETAAGFPLWPYQGEVGVSFWRAQFYYLRGTAWWGLGDIMQAQAQFRLALERCDRIGEQRFKAHVLDLMAYIRLEEGAAAEAQELAAAALQLSNACGDHLWVSHLQVILGRIALAQGRRSKARRHAQAALAFARTSGELFILQEALHLLGRVELACEHTDDAEARFAESMAALAVRGLDRYFLQAAGLVGLGDAAGARGDYVRAQQCYTEALCSAGRTAWDAAYARAGLAQIYARQGDVEAALVHAGAVSGLSASPAAARAACKELLRRLQG
jgi:tetratricopeptide (TPR) repeat protein